MTGERYLSFGREYTQAVVGSLVGWRADERRLRQVGPGRNRLHPVARHRVAVEHDRDRVALERHGGEHVDLPEGELLHHALLWDSGVAASIALQPRRGGEVFFLEKGRVEQLRLRARAGIG
jgi:hypothetical protein